MFRRAVVLTAALLTLSCERPSSVPFSILEDDFVNTMLAFSPVLATSQGYHSHLGVDLDPALDDISSGAIEGRRSYLASFRQRLGQMNPAGLTPEERADLGIIQDVISGELFDLDTAQSWRHNPTGYVELIGSALFNPYMVNYAPKSERARHIIARLEKIPAFCTQARKNLEASPPIWAKVAQEENDGTVELIDKTLRAFIPEEQRPAYDSAALIAITSLRSFNGFLAAMPHQNLNGTVPDWRLGDQSYRTKFRYALGTDLSPDQVLGAAEADLKRVRGQMHSLAKQILGNKAQGNESADIASALNQIAAKRSTVDSYIPDARADLAEAIAFAAQSHLLTLPRNANLQVIETPAFLRGIYAVGGFNPAPALQPELGAFYWITPIPATWEKALIDSKLREYNFYNLKLLTIHEAMPGHYVQAEFANNLQPKPRRVLRAVWGNTPYVEGWAQYITEAMLDAGYLSNAPELRLTFLKQELRVVANAIMDIRLQTNRMTEAQAMELMERDTFQEHEEAIAKLQRAQLSSAQLPAYFVGWRDWRRVREQYAKTKGSQFQAESFHDAALKEGAVPLPILFRLLTGKDLAK